ncbi:MAG: hypothetical protein JO041_15630 [Acidobacteria bacterium]|nr:hypothetical protein [Acidobacteriota bacterium]
MTATSIISAFDEALLPHERSRELDPSGVRRDQFGNSAVRQFGNFSQPYRDYCRWCERLNLAPAPYDAWYKIRQSIDEANYSDWT